MSAPAAPEPVAEPLWLEWAALAGRLLFATRLLGVRGVRALLLHAEPTDTTAVITAVQPKLGPLGKATAERYCQRAGLVKLLREEPAGSALLRGGTMTLELTAWQ